MPSTSGVSMVLFFSRTQREPVPRTVATCRDLVGSKVLVVSPVAVDAQTLPWDWHIDLQIDLLFQPPPKVCKMLPVSNRSCLGFVPHVGPTLRVETASCRIHPFTRTESGANVKAFGPQEPGAEHITSPESAKPQVGNNMATEILCIMTYCDIS